MNYWREELDLVAGAALRIEGLELKAEREFNRILLLARAHGEPGIAVKTPEFAAWMKARSDSNAAWNRWFEVVCARPRED